MPNAIADFRGQYAFLSNFYEAPVSLAGVTFKTNEHAFQACKGRFIVSGDMTAQARAGYMAGILACKTPTEAKKLGNEVKIELGFWVAARVEIMSEIVMAKFQQNPELARKLVNTGHAMLVEGNTWNDTFWGRCNGKGSNVLGAILMETRGVFLWGRNYGNLNTDTGESQHPIN